MANIELTKSYNAEAAVPANRIVRFGAADYGVVLASAATDALVGVSTEIAADPNERIDVIHQGIADVQLGGTVTRGALITSNATGQGVAAAPAAGANNRYIGTALIAGVSGDIIPVLLNPGSIQG